MDILLASIGIGIAVGLMIVAIAGVLATACIAAILLGHILRPVFEWFNLKMDILQGWRLG